MTRAPFEAKQLNGAYYLPEQGRLECVLHKLYDASLCVTVSLKCSAGWWRVLRVQRAFPA